MKTDHEHWMNEAVSEAGKGLGKTSPNPSVGAVVVKGNRCVGRGFHAKAGKPHAEVNALNEAGHAAKGADLYVTLEPCSTTGRTPPCTDAIRQAGIRKVVIGCVDPNPNHAGRAVQVLKEAGIESETGILESECRNLIRAFTHVQQTGFPYITLKLACTLDGRIADRVGKSQWITGKESRMRVQALRREADAILVGTETVCNDNPSLTPRPAYGHKPIRLIPDRTGRIPFSSKVFTDGQPTLCLTGKGVSDTRIRRLQKQGVDILPVSGTHRIAWKSTLKKIAGKGINHILCEGGGMLSASLLKAGLVQDIHWIVAPTLLGETGRPAVAGSWKLDQAPGFEVVEVDRIGADTWFRLFPKN